MHQTMRMRKQDDIYTRSWTTLQNFYTLKTGGMMRNGWSDVCTSCSLGTSRRSNVIRNSPLLTKARRAFLEDTPINCSKRLESHERTTGSG